MSKKGKVLTAVLKRTGLLASMLLLANSLYALACILRSKMNLRVLLYKFACGGAVVRQHLLATLLLVATIGAQAQDTKSVLGDSLDYAVLMVYGGTSEDSARAISIDLMTERVKVMFPKTEVREAFTSKAAIGALKRRRGIEKQTFPQAMLDLRKDGYNRVLTVCCEMIDGFEAGYMQRHIELLRNKFYDIKMTTPLLYTLDDCRAALKPLVDGIHASDDEEVVLVGHGRDGAANDVYCLADYILQHEGHANCHVGTISGYPSLDNIKQILKERNAKKVVLAPLIMVAAGHATKDIYKTWREALEAEGYEVRVVRQAALEYPEIRELVIQKIIKTIEEP